MIAVVAIEEEYAGSYGILRARGVRFGARQGSGGDTTDAVDLDAGTPRPAIPTTGVPRSS